jgi:cytoskeletal protein RodZ
LKLLFNSISTQTLLVVTLIAVLTASLSAGIYFTISPDQTNPPNELSPTPTQTTNTSPTPQSAKTSPTASPSPSQQPRSLPYFDTQPTPIPAIQNGLLDDLVNEQKGSLQTAAHSANGNWSSYFEFAPPIWTAGTTVRVAVALNYSEELLSNYKLTYPRVDNACLLLTAERDFDPAGFQHTPWNEQISTILTPSGLPIEGGGSAAISSYTGYTQKTPVDVMIEVPIANFPLDNTGQIRSGKFLTSFTLPQNLPPGIYRLRFDFGFKSGSTRYNFNGNGIATRPTDLNNVSCVFSPPIPASGVDIKGNWIDGSQITRRSYWALLWDYNSNGYRGVVAKEDKSKVAVSPRNLIHDEIILPRFNTAGTALTYNIEPTFLLDNANFQRNIPWRYDHGNWEVKITYPNGTIKDLGTAAFLARRGNGITTKNTSFTSWKPPMYGNYTIEGKGWMEDIWGNRYEGGGNYSFWIAERLTLATATFQGQPYNVGNRYGRDMAFNPPVAANVTVKASLYFNSNPNNVSTVISIGQATSGGIFGSMQGLKPLPLTAPGEYYATVLATYWDTKGTLWVSAMRHAGVVYPMDSSIEAHGKKINLAGGVIADRGEQHWEGYTLTNGTSVLDHINFPYNAYDVLLIASEQQTSNKIEPVMTYTVKGSNATYNTTLQTIGRTNIIIKTSNSLSPEMFPEYITDLQYFYGSAPRPGFNSRFIVSHDNIRAPYWPTSPNSFGGQISASNNGDLPGDIYRLLGGVVLRNNGQTPAYAGYQASGFILPKGTNNNRIIGPGDEDLPSPDGIPARFFLTPLRPGMVYSVGATFGAVLQIDPVVPCSVRFTLTAPNGTTFVTTGNGDQYGYFVAVDKWLLDKAGLWVYNVTATWNNTQGRVPGMPIEGGWIFVLENGPAPGTGMQLNLSTTQTFSPTAGLNVTGNTTASKVYYAAIIPGAVLEEGILKVNNCMFQYTFDPQRMAEKIKTYDIVNLVNGKPEIGRVVHLTFFSNEQGFSGDYHSFARVVLRGTTAIYIKER